MQSARMSYIADKTCSVNGATLKSAASCRVLSASPVTPSTTKTGRLRDIAAAARGGVEGDEDFSSGGDSPSNNKFNITNRSSNSETIATPTYALQLRRLLPVNRLQMATSFVIGVDVGSRSARAALVTLKGYILRKAERPLTVREQKGEIFEQSAEQIWTAVCECVREVASSVSVDDIKGIGFDATCSLVITDCDGRPVSVSADGDNDFNVIMWCDHRAREEADLINKTHHDVLRRVGGRISPEMEPPKLLWLKRHMPHSFQRIANAFDLPDYLTHRSR